MRYALSYDVETNSPILTNWVLANCVGDYHIEGRGIDILLSSLPTPRASIMIYVFDLNEFSKYLIFYLQNSGFKAVEHITKSRQYSVLKKGKNILEVIIPTVKNGDRYRLCRFRGLAPVCALNLIDFGTTNNQDVSTLYGLNKAVKMALSFYDRFGCLDKLTVGAFALSEVRKNLGVRRFKTLFPELSFSNAKLCIDAFFGGYVYLNPIYAGKLIGEGVEIDANSKYGDILCKYPLPYGIPKRFVGDPPKNYPLYILRFSASCKLKSGRLPILSRMQNYLSCSQTYVDDTNGIVELILPSTDIELLFENYDVKFFSPIEGIAFKSKTGILKDYITKWYEIKKSSYGLLKLLAKKMIVCCYGMFAKRMDNNRSLYPAMSVFISAWARYTTIKDAQAMHDAGRFIYANTDALFIDGLQLPDFPIGNEIGQYKIESKFKAAKFLKPQCYCYYDGFENVVKISGLPKSSRAAIDVERLATGMTVKVKRKKPTEGGYIIKETDYKIK